MRDPHICLRRKEEARLSGFHPRCERAQRGQAAERIVDFHRVEAARIVLQEFLGGQLLRIETWLPARVRKAGRACEELRHAGYELLCLLLFLLTDADLKLLLLRLGV